MLLQASHTQEVAVLKEKQQLELQQAQEVKAKQQAAIEDLEKGVGQLKLQQQELVAKHNQDKEALLTAAEQARNAAVQVYVRTRSVMHLEHCRGQLLVTSRHCWSIRCGLILRFGMVQEVQVIMDTKVKSVNEELAEHRQSLQVCYAWIVCLYMGENHQGSMLEYCCTDLYSSSNRVMPQLRPSDVTFACVNSPCPD